jgi:hypothetical protein
MDPPVTPESKCARCGAPRADLYNPQGDLVCRGCAALPAAEAQLAQGRRAGFSGAVFGLFLGAVILVGTVGWAFPLLSGASSRYEGRLVARVLGLGLALGIGLLVVSWRNLRTFS